jgi:hypothetical protein
MVVKDGAQLILTAYQFASLREEDLIKDKGRRKVRGKGSIW